MNILNTSFNWKTGFYGIMYPPSWVYDLVPKWHFPHPYLSFYPTLLTSYCHDFSSSPASTTFVFLSPHLLQSLLNTLLVWPCSSWYFSISCWGEKPIPISTLGKPDVIARFNCHKESGRKFCLVSETQLEHA